MFLQILVLVQRTNADWWQIRKTDGVEGFVPANYVKETEPKVSSKVVKRPMVVPEKVRVKKTVMKKEVVKKKPEKSSKLRRAPSGKNISDTRIEHYLLSKKRSLSETGILATF